MKVIIEKAIYSNLEFCRPNEYFKEHSSFSPISLSAPWNSKSVSFHVPLRHRCPNTNSDHTQPIFLKLSLLLARLPHTKSYDI